MKFVSLAVVAVGLALSGCSTTATANHPGAVNAFDSATYDVLLTAQAAIDAARPLATAQNAKDILNRAIAAYNVTEAAYQTYHAALAGGTATAAQTSALQAQIATLKTSIAALPVAAPAPAKP